MFSSSPPPSTSSRGHVEEFSGHREVLGSAGKKTKGKKESWSEEEGKKENLCRLSSDSTSATMTGCWRSSGQQSELVEEWKCGHALELLSVCVCVCVCVCVFILQKQRKTEGDKRRKDATEKEKSYIVPSDICCFKIQKKKDKWGKSVCVCVCARVCVCECVCVCVCVWDKLLLVPLPPVNPGMAERRAGTTAVCQHVLSYISLYWRYKSGAPLSDWTPPSSGGVSMQSAK